MNKTKRKLFEKSNKIDRPLIRLHSWNKVGWLEEEKGRERT